MQKFMQLCGSSTYCTVDTNFEIMVQSVNSNVSQDSMDDVTGDIAPSQCQRCHDLRTSRPLDPVPSIAHPKPYLATILQLDTKLNVEGMP